jgi:prepilin-type processing-associated H-X9-DG protein
MLVVMAMIAILAALLLPTLSQAKARAQRIQCVNHLRQLGIGFQSFAHDHNGLFPMEVPTQSGGTLEFVQSGYRVTGPFYFSFRHFQALSNELAQVTKVLVCPSDSRPPAANFRYLKNDNLSFFVSVSSTYSTPTTILAGDRNLTNGTKLNATTIQLAPGQVARWTDEIHRLRGNLLFADGHVSESRTISFAAAHAATGGRIWLPTVQAPTFASGSATSGQGEALERSRAGRMSTPARTRSATPSKPIQAPEEKAPLVSPPVAEEKPLPGIAGEDSSSISTSSSPQPVNQEQTSLLAMASESPEKRSTNAMAMAPSEGAPTITSSGSDTRSTAAFAWFTDVLGLTQKAVWLMYALMVLVAGAALYLRRQIRKKSTAPAPPKWP